MPTPDRNAETVIVSYDDEEFTLNTDGLTTEQIIDGLCVKYPERFVKIDNITVEVLPPEEPEFQVILERGSKNEQ